MVRRMERRKRWGGGRWEDKIGREGTESGVGDIICCGKEKAGEEEVGQGGDGRIS